MILVILNRYLEAYFHLKLKIDFVYNEITKKLVKW